MKSLNYKLLVFFCCLPLFFTSCWEDLPAYDEAEITKVGFYHRFAGSGRDPITNEPIMVETELSCKCDINSEAATVYVDVVIPAANGEFTEEERTKVVQSKLWGYFNISTAAKVVPASGSPILGTPGDWTSPHQYEIVAANGFKKVWTVTVRSLSK